MSQNPRVGVVLSSGGGRGVYAHTGFLMALEKLGITVKVISGCSAGALVGGVAASGTPLAKWAEAIARVHVAEYWTPDGWLRLVWQLAVRKGRGYTGLSDTAAAVDFVRRHLAVQTFEECPIPFYALAMNLSTGNKAYFSSGALAPRIMASAAMPVLYRPVAIDGELFADGATIELAPSESLCCKHGLDVLILHHASVNREGPAGMERVMNGPWSLVEILYLLLYRRRPWYLSGQAFSVHRCPAGCGASIMALEPTLPELRWPLSKGGPEVQAAAMAQTEQVLGSRLANLSQARPRSIDRAGVAVIEQSLS
ncbi:MAG: patatin-like phospholipase family protein [Pseudomonadota bacterium]